ncbi:hypothetical protein AHMF7605_11615 [Adhaeribacter arboris]|uniref:Uncharacterized protein n=1 Tax=Adhaeribacter arboris TaxID=2072846 RepID=A0A2T2YF30_9BACT|nr:hypothetical protein AHMF7605_11615 [Adhaeribacter arboris]
MSESLYRVTFRVIFSDGTKCSRWYWGKKYKTVQAVLQAIESFKNNTGLSEWRTTFTSPDGIKVMSKFGEWRVEHYYPESK